MPFRAADPPMRRHPPPHPTHAPVLPQPDNTFNFEFRTHVYPPPGHPQPVHPQRPNVPYSRQYMPPTHPPVPQAAPRSHHTPALGLGGALISYNRQQALREQAEMQRDRVRGRRFRVPFSIHDLFAGNRSEAEIRQFQAEELMREREDDWFFDEGPYEFLFGHFGGGGGGGGGGPPILQPDIRRFEPEYRREWTHPSKPDPGFTFDFAPADEPPQAGPSSSSSTMEVIDVTSSPVRAGPSTETATQEIPSLVCAICGDDLLMLEGAHSEEDRHKFKIWALRCGHIIDGKCLDRIIAPLQKPLEEEVIPPTWSRKGKGKARADALPPPPPPPGALEMRSRLRSFNAAPDVPSHPKQPRSGSTRSKRGSSSKGKGRSELEEEYIWYCPVPSCANRHISIKKNGRWEVDAHRGPIGLFV
jgi:hypothetical protein